VSKPELIGYRRPDRGNDGWITLDLVIAVKGPGGRERVAMRI